jgi:putative tricarboxylic transport membrane protein
VRVNDALIGTLLIVFAVAMMAYTVTFPRMPGQDYGPALFPQVIGTAMVLCGILLVIRGIRAWRAEPLIAFGDWARSPRHVFNLLLVLAALLFYILFSNDLGFVITAIIILLSLFLAFGVRAVVSVPLAVAVTLVIHYFFATLLRVPLPWGILTPYAW